MKAIIGCSGYSYEDWRGTFYPQWANKSEMLDYYAEHFSIVEINVTFYQMPSAALVERWKRARVKYIIKYNQGITHERKLEGVEELLRDFHSRILPLFREGKIIAFLVQLPPSLPRNYALLQNFLQQIPCPEMHAVEFRHRSWFTPETVDILRKYGAAFVMVDAPGLPSLPYISTRWGYLRMHGRALHPDWYHYLYSHDELEEWCRKIAPLRDILDFILILFNNHPHGNAPKNAMEMSSILSTMGVEVVRSGIPL